MAINRLLRLYQRATTLITQYFKDEITTEEFQEGFQRLEKRTIHEKSLKKENK